MRKILVVIGAYSEAIQIAPLVHRLQALSSMQTVVCTTRQHRQMLNRFLGIFGIRPDEELGSTVGPLHEIDFVIGKYRPDCVLMHGNTSAMIESVYLSNPFANMDSGLQMYELAPKGLEETRRGEIDLSAKCYFVPLESLRDNLIGEGVAPEKIYLTDGLEVDALLTVVGRIRSDHALKSELESAFPFLDRNKRLILVTEHRHENRDGRLERLCRALKRLAMRSDVQVVYPVHTDPKMNAVVDEVFAGHPNIALVQPQDYLHFACLMHIAHIIVTDLGAPLKGALSLNKPVLVVRDVAERPETIDAGTVKLVGSDSGHVLRECTMFLDDPSYYRAYSMHRNPYSDGEASRRIVEILLR